MEQLKGKTILIGKEPGNGRLQVSVNINGQIKNATIGQIGSVPKCVSRCMPQEGTAHCKITVDQAGNMTITNLKAQNVTYVDGMEIMSKRITPSNSVALGKERYMLDINTVIIVVQKMASTVQQQVAQPTPQAEYSIKQLEHVWNDYHDQMYEIKSRQKQIGLLRSASPIFTLGSGAVATMAKSLDWSSEVFFITGAMTIIGLILMIYSFYKGYTDKSLDETEHITEEFQSRYVCPNPKCHHFMGMQPYNILKQNKNCPYCKCKLTDK